MKHAGADGQPVADVDGAPRLDARVQHRRSRRAAGPSGPSSSTRRSPSAAISLEPPAYFKTDEPDADRMTYGELKHYIAQLQASGYHVVPYMVQLQRKVAFPFVTLVMTLLAVPFAVTTGRRGALYGIGVGIVLALIVLDDAEHLRRARRGRLDVADARRVGAEHPVRRRGRLSAADRPHVRTGAGLDYCSSAAFRIQIRPESPGLVFVASTTNRMLRMPSRTRLDGVRLPHRREVVEEDRVLLRRRVDVDRPLPPLARRLALDRRPRAAAPRSASGARRES